MHLEEYYQTFVPDPATVRSEYRLKQIIAEFEAEYQKNCSKIGFRLSPDENTRLVSEKGRLI